MEQYLTTKELSVRIKMTPGTIRNLVWKKVLVENVHYVRPTPRKLLFKWTVMENWLHGCSAPSVPHAKGIHGEAGCRINI